MSRDSTSTVQSSQERGRPTAPAESFESGFQKLKTQLHRELLDSIDLSRISTMTDAQLRRHVGALSQNIFRNRPQLLSKIDEERLIDELIAESFGLGPLEPYMHDPEVADILVNGPHEVYVERRGRLFETNTVFADDEHLLQIIQRIVSRVGRRIDSQSPMVDARLADGSRINAVIPPLSLNGPTLSIRRFGRYPLDIERLQASGSTCPEIVQFLKAIIEGRINVMISGGTGSGKTTMLNALSPFIPADERLVTIEDSAELQLRRKHVVRLETRIPTSEGAGAVTARDLVRNALRMRPDRIILGEVRSGEALDMLQAMNTGHEGSLTTIHANDARDALSRLEVMVAMAGFDLPVSVMRRYIASAINVIVHLARLKGGVRRMMRIVEIVDLENNEYQLRELFRFQQAGLDADGFATGRFHVSGNVTAFFDRLRERGIELDADLFQARVLGDAPKAETAKTVGAEPTVTVQPLSAFPNTPFPSTLFPTVPAPMEVAIASEFVDAEPLDDGKSRSVEAQSGEVKPESGEVKREEVKLWN